MKAGFCMNVFDNHEIEEAMPRLAGIGYDGVELWDQNLQGMDLDRLADQVHEADLEVAQLNPYFDFTDRKEKWDETMRIHVRYLEHARTFGARMVRVFTGHVGSAEATEARR